MIPKTEMLHNTLTVHICLPSLHNDNFVTVTDIKISTFHPTVVSDFKHNYSMHLFYDFINTFN
jgi:hypothetical protein